jgi:hypothetical protein
VSNPIKIAVLGFWRVHAAEYATRTHTRLDQRDLGLLPRRLICAPIGHFADWLRPGSRPLHTEKEGIDVLCLILAAYEGSRSRSIAAVARIQDL